MRYTHFSFKAKCHLFTGKEDTTTGKPSQRLIILQWPLNDQILLFFSLFPGLVLSS